MSNYKRSKPRDKKVYRNGTDGRGCPWCGSNWEYSKKISRIFYDYELGLL